MLIKMMSRPLSRPDLHQLITYINQGQESFDNEPHFMIRYNTTGNSAKKVSDDFKQNNSLIKQRKGKRNGVVHIILSWHEKEHHLLDDTKLFDFGQKFCELINGDNSLIFCRPHYDKKNIHLHIAQSASLLNSGRSTRISKARLKEIQIEMNKYQKEYYKELKHSLLYLPELEKSRESSLGIPLPDGLKEVDGSIRAKMRGTTSQLEILRNQLLKLAKKYPEKQRFLKSINSESKIAVYSRNAKPTGIITETGKKYRFKRLALDIDNLSRVVRLHELDKIKNRDNQQDQALER